MKALLFSLLEKSNNNSYANTIIIRHVFQATGFIIYYYVGKTNIF